MSQSIPRVFISYSHDSVEHKAFVLQLANRLRADGLDCQLDQYINGSPPEGWQRWMEEQIELADFVLLICTETYYRRYRGKETQGGYGVNFEGLVISQNLYEAYYKNKKFIPVLSDNLNSENIPIPLRHYSNFNLPHNYNELYRFLTNQPATPKPILGTVKLLPLGKLGYSKDTSTATVFNNVNLLLLSLAVLIVSFLIFYTKNGCDFISDGKNPPSTLNCKNITDPNDLVMFLEAKKQFDIYQMQIYKDYQNNEIKHNPLDSKKIESSQ